ncbi:MAG TPA: hypothetical protein VKX40_13955 [Aequorivita sp.]|nr:hypothetical protein [Aequorivita sp.]
MKRIFLLCIGILVFFSISSNIIQTKNDVSQNVNSNLTSEDSLQIDDFQIGGIKLDYKIGEVEKIFGKPDKIYIVKEDEWKCYEYPGLTFIYDIRTQKLLVIKVKRSDLKTFRGISVGDTKEEVIYRYGKSEYEEYGYLNYQKHVIVDYWDYFYAINFSLKEGKVDEIMIYFAPD